MTDSARAPYRFPVVQWLGAGSWQAPASSKPREAIRVPAEPIEAPRGALTGLNLPKKYLKEKHLPDGDLPPLPYGLPNTSQTALQELMLAIVVQGLADDALAYIVSPTFIHHLLYIGLDPDAALNVKIAYLQGKVAKDGLLAMLHTPRKIGADVRVWP